MNYGKTLFKKDLQQSKKGKEKALLFNLSLKRVSFSLTEHWIRQKCSTQLLHSCLKIINCVHND